MSRRAYLKTLETQLVLSVDVWKAIWSDSKSILNVAGKKPARGEVPSTSESILTTLLLLQKIAVNQVRVHFPILVSPDLARLVRLVIVLRSDSIKTMAKGHSDSLAPR